MFRILIVDDERIILNGIRMMIQEELALSFPVDIVTASNVPRAIELFDSFHPDLILTDVRMPVMDGFELIRYVREKDPSVNIAILTSHADFAYAQKAIRFQVMDFILKPVDPQLLADTIRRTRQQKEERCKDRLHAALLEVRSLMLYDLSPQELTCAPELINQLFPSPCFTVIVLSVPGVRETYPKIFEEILTRYYSGCYCFCLQERNQLVAICNHDQFLVKPANLEREFADASGCREFWTGISINAVSWKALHVLYINAVQRIFYARHFGQSSELTEISLFTYQDCVRIFLENDEEAARQKLNDYLTRIRAFSDQRISAEKICKSFFHNLLLYLENNGISVPEDRVCRACSAVDDRELEREILDRMGALKGIIRKKQENCGNETLTRQLLNYIRQHFREDMSLDDLAAAVGLHPNYVCTVFKKNIGKSYLECLHRERLGEAKRLLSETDLTIEQIADQVGYNSASQLARVFRKYENISPSAFRTQV